MQTANNNNALETLRRSGYPQAVIDEAGKIRIENALQHTAAINRLLVNSSIDVHEIYIKNVSLEDYYLSVTGGYHHG